MRHIARERSQNGSDACSGERSGAGAIWRPVRGARPRGRGRDRFDGPRPELSRAGIEPIGTTTCELAYGSLREYRFCPAQIEFMGEITAGRVIFGPDTVEPILGTTALESVGITVDPATRTLKRLPAIPLK
jgi:hypothetical protein